MRRAVEVENGEALWSDERVTDPGFHLPLPYLRVTASWLQRWGIMPRAGGLEDQDKHWVDDMQIWFHLKAEAQEAYEDSKPKS